MSENKTPNDYTTTEEPTPAIDFATDYLNIFDSLSTRLKRGYSRTSVWVIVITFFTSFLAVLSPLLTNSFLSEELTQALQTIIKALLIALPFIAVALLDYSRQFITNTAWIYFREAAERIRSNIHLFEMKAGEYKGHDNDFACQRKLVVKIKMIYEDYDHLDMVDIDNKNRNKTWFNHLMGIPDWIMDKSIKMFEQMAISEPNTSRKLTAGADAIDKYIHNRLDYQLTWYDQRIKGDYKKMLYARVAIIIITAISGIVAAFATDFSITIVAILSSLGTAINLVADTLMYGATYSIYDDAMRKLKLIKADWQIKQVEGSITEEDKVKLVEDVEEVLRDELELWKEGMKRKAEASERAVLKNLNENPRFDPALDNLNTNNGNISNTNGDSSGTANNASESESEMTTAG